MTLRPFSSDEPWVSIVSPTLNPGPRLARCIHSIKEQTYPRAEYIIIDGGSSEGTITLLKKSQGLTWISEPDNGQSSAITKGPPGSGNVSWASSTRMMPSARRG